MARLVVVPTPIGNLKDITFRAVEILRDADLIAAEDTRTSGKLLRHYEIQTPVTSLHQHNEHKRVGPLVEKVLEEDLVLAVITDAGMPGISDPGYLVVKEAIEQGLEVEVLPGANAAITALAGSGLPAHQFFFVGFLPQKKGRKTMLESLIEVPVTMIFYESPHRLERTLRDLEAIFGGTREIVVARELTKVHEEYVRGTVSEVHAYFKQKPAKGEIVILAKGKN